MLIKLGRRKPKSMQSVVRGALLYLRLLAAAGVFAGMFSAARAELPVACGGAACASRGGPSQWVTFGSATPSINGNTMTIHQNSDRAILNWESFNVGKENTVHFQQPSKHSVALNRVWSTTDDPSRILGVLTATGEVWLINRNGIVFGENAQVNVNSLVASTLDVTDGVFERGLKTALAEDKLASFVQSGTGLDSDGNPVAIRLEKGARLVTQDEGRVLLFAPAIENNGTIATNNGQVVLAAGHKVWLEQGDSDLRGILVEVDQGGSVDNFGDIIAKRGNATIVGLAINQSGRVTATTASNVNGSIYLHARDEVDAKTLAGTLQNQTTRTGTVEFGSGSVTSVIPDVDDTALLTDDQAQPSSKVDIMGKTIHLASGARVIVPGGTVNMTATVDPRGSAAGSPNDSRVQMDSGSSIDVSGTTDAVASVSRNVIEVELRGLQLADAPLQRDGTLRNQNVKIDIRTVDADGNIPIANVSEAVKGIGRGLSERMATGGTVTLKSEGGVVLNAGSVVDVSGGQMRYEGGLVETTRLISNGRIVDISEADPGAIYSGVLGYTERSYNKWGITEQYRTSGSRRLAHYEAGYVEGKDAGTLNVAARGVVLDGEVRGEVTPGTHQRAPASGTEVAWERPYDQVPLAGQLVIGDVNSASDARTPDVVIQAGGQAQQAWRLPDALPDGLPLVLTPELFDRGVNRLKVNSNGTITIAKDTGLTLAAGGAVSLKAGVAGTDGAGAPGIDVQGRISVAGGKIELDSTFNININSGGIALGEHAALNVAGQWVNDTPALNPDGARAGTYIAGGTINMISGGDVTLARGSVLDASGGAWLRDNGSLKAGRGGNVSIESKYDGPAQLALNGEIRGYALEKGGTFSLKAPSVLITSRQDAAAVPGQLVLAPELFQSGGFNAYDIGATRDGLTVADGTQLAPRARNAVLDANYRLQATATPLRDFASVRTLEDDQRAPVNLSLSSARSENTLGSDAGTTVGTGAHIELDPGASVKLSSDRMLIVDGAITALGGSVELKLSDSLKDVYRPDRAIWLGENARIDARAHAQMQPSALGLREGRMLDAGSIALTAERGFIVTEAGSVLNVSGAAQTFDLRIGSGATAGHVPVTVAGDAGTIALTASDGMLLDGAMRAHAAAVEGAAGGALKVTLRGETFGNPDRAATGAPQGVRAVALTQSQSPRVPVGSQPGDALLTAEQIAQLRPNQSNSVESVARLSQEHVAAAGFDSVALAVAPVLADSATVQPGSNAVIRFDGDVDLSLRRSLTLDAAVIAGADGNVNLHAPYIALGQSNTTFQKNTPPQGGDGTLSIDANHVDLIGTLSLQGFGSAEQPALRIHSDGDVRLQGVMYNSNKSRTGALRSAGDVIIDAAQIYPSTLTHYRIDVEGATDGTVRIGSTGTAQAPLSAAGSLEINAPHVVQAGTLRAPFGSITLAGTKDVVLASGSETSVSGAGLSVPFGKIQLGQQWLLPVPGGIEVRVNDDVPDPGAVALLPEKAVTLEGPVIDHQPGAVVNVAGGGELTAYEFIPGPGGSNDVLAGDFTAGRFAVVPGLGIQYAPSDLKIGTAGIDIGTTVHLAGVEGLPAGEYAVLPARYALLPGAFLVTKAAMSGPVGADARYTRPDGVPVIAGRFGVAGTDTHDSVWSAFIVENGAQVRRRTEYREVTADRFFTAQAQTLGLAGVPELPRDAGSLVLDATERLELSGRFKGDSALGRAGRVDVVGENVAIVNQRAPLAGRIELVAADLNQLGAQSLLIGGRRHVMDDGIEVDISASTVEVEDGVRLEVPELLLAAHRPGTGASEGDGAVRVGRDASITASAAPGRGGVETLVIGGDSALLRVSSSPQADIVRRDATEAGASRVRVEDGASLSASITAPDTLSFGGSIALDAAGDVLNSGELRVADGGALHLGASRISLGETDGRDIAQGIVLSNQDLAALDAGEVRLVSASTVDLYGAVDLTTRNLELDSAGLRGFDGDGKTAVLSATDVLQLANSRGTATADAGTGHGELQVMAREIRLGSSDSTPEHRHIVDVSGFDSVRLKARERVIANGSGEFRSSGDVSVEAGATTAESAADWTVRAEGALRAQKVATDQVLEAVQSLGAKLRFEGESIDYRGDINLASGVATFTATATGVDGDVRIGGDAVINVAGVTKEFVDVAVSSPGGRVELNAEHGDVVVESGVRIVVTGGQGADAGILQVAAPEGQAQLDGSFRANAKPTTDANGSFILDVANLADFSALNTRLNEGGFGGERNLRVRNGNLLVDTGDVVKAHAVTLTADGLDGGGNIEVLGTIDASGGAGGSISLNAARDVSLRAGAQLHANATAENNDGGRVFVATTQGEITFEKDATIDVHGTREVALYEQVLDTNGALKQATDESGAPIFDANGMPVYVQRTMTTDTGTVWFRAPQLSGADGVAVTTLNGGIVGAGAVTIEAFKTTQDADGNLTASEMTARANEARTFMNTHAANIAARLGWTTDPRFHVIPGVEIRGANDLALSQELDLSAWRFGPRNEAGALTLRAEGDVVLSGHVTDGVSLSPNPITGVEEPVLRHDDSSSIRIAAGADTTSADVLAVVGGKGDVTVGSGVIVRTGTGDIDIVAGRDLVMQDNAAAIYTLGVDDGVGTLNPLLAAYYLNASYAVNGGDVRIRAGRDIDAAPTDQLVNNWLARIGGPHPLLGVLPTAWAVNFNNFKQGVAALGGGDVSVRAGRDINDLSVSVVTTGKQVGENTLDDNGTTAVLTNQIVVSGGDHMDISAGGDIKGGVYYIAQGEGTLHASARVADSDKSRFAPLIALGDARMDVRGGTGVELETVFNPTLVSQSVTQALVPGVHPASYFSTYMPESAVTVTAVTGDSVLGENGLDPTSVPFFNGNADDGEAAENSNFPMLRVYPANVKVRALEGDVGVEKNLDLAPGERGQLELLAANNVQINEATITMRNSDPSSVPTPSQPDSAIRIMDMTTAALHAGDDEPVRIYAMSGYIGAPIGVAEFSEVDLAKSVHLYGGGDIRDLNITVLHANVEDHSVLEAGGNITNTTDGSGLNVAGGGRVDIIAGGSIDLGTSSGIRTSGNRALPFLPERGADISILAGIKRPLDHEGFIQRYLIESRDYDQALVKFLARETVDPALSAADNFKRLPREAQREFILEVFFSELRKSTPETEDHPADYTPGFNAIATLFPDVGAYTGDLTMLLSQIKTEDGGDINILVPGGLANVGVANRDGVTKDTDQLGIVVARDGNINAFVNGDFLVNSSRVFALNGGDIVLWSTVGDIDAGKGSKSAFSIPAAAVIYNTDAKPIAFDPPTAIEGSGIRQAVTTPGKQAGSVYLFAPKGKIDAGDAGIDIAGNLIVGATSVVGTDNIKVGGISVGVPVSDAGALAGTLSGVSNIASGVSKSAEQSVEQATRADQATTTPIADAALTFLEVEVLGYGEKECRNDDRECEEK